MPGLHLRSLLSALYLLLALPMTAQETPAESQAAAQFEERLDVIEVLVDVLATDRKGRVVTGLTAADFMVEEEGKSRSVTSATFYSTRYEDLDSSGGSGSPPPAGFPPPDVPASRYFVLFFHDQTFEARDRARLTSNRLRAAREARTWIDTEMGPSDWVAVVRFDYRLTVQLDFSQERLKIDEAIESATMNRRTEALRPSVRARRESPGGGPSLTAGLPHIADLERASLRMEDAVRLVATAARPIIGRKNMILFTLGFGRAESPLGSPDARYYPAMEAALNESNVAVYPIDLSGSGNQSPQNNFLSQLADETGGVYFSTFNRFLDALRSISRYNTGYYLLSFESTVPSGETGYRNFKVKTTAPKVRIRARRGYAYGQRP